jgi:hypothetical protein
LYISVNCVPSTSTLRTLKPFAIVWISDPVWHRLRNADGVAVVLYEEEHGELIAAREVQRLEELALGSRALAGRDVDDLVGPSCLDRLRHPGGLQVLRPRARGRGDDAKRLGREVLAHVPAAAARVVGLREHVKEDVLRRHPQADHERLLTVVGEEPVLSGGQKQRHGDLQLLVSARGRVERNFAGADEDLEPLFDGIDREHLVEQVEVDRAAELGARDAGDG